MPGGFTNQPKILCGTFVEYSLSIFAQQLELATRRAVYSGSGNVEWGFEGEDKEGKKYAISFGVEVVTGYTPYNEKFTEKYPVRWAGVRAKIPFD